MMTLIRKLFLERNFLTDEQAQILARIKFPCC